MNKIGLNLIQIMVGALIMVIIAIIAAFAGYMYRKKIAEGKINDAQLVAQRIISDAEKESETIKKEKLVEAKEEAHKLRGEAEKEYRERRLEVQKFEKRVLQKEETLDKKISQVEEKDARYNDKFRKLEDKENKINELAKNKDAELVQFGDRLQRTSLYPAFRVCLERRDPDDKTLSKVTSEINRMNGNHYQEMELWNRAITWYQKYGVVALNEAREVAAMGIPAPVEES